MQCNICGADEEVGAFYTIYYGTNLYTTYGKGSTWITHYRIDGKENGFLCQQCIIKPDKQIRRIGIYLALVVGALVMLMALPIKLTSDDGDWILCPALGGTLLALAALSKLLEPTMLKLTLNHVINSEEVASSRAINMRKADLKQSGYDAFFTPLQYNRLKSSSGGLFS